MVVRHRACVTSTRSNCGYELSKNRADMWAVCSRCASLVASLGSAVQLPLTTAPSVSVLARVGAAAGRAGARMLLCRRFRVNVQSARSCACAYFLNVTHTHPKWIPASHSGAGTGERSACRCSHFQCVPRCSPISSEQPSLAVAVTVEHVSPGFTFCVSVPDSEPPSLPSLMENVTVTPSASELDELELLDAAWRVEGLLRRGRVRGDGGRRRAAVLGLVGVRAHIVDQRFGALLLIQELAGRPRSYTKLWQSPWRGPSGPRCCSGTGSRPPLARSARASLNSSMAFRRGGRARRASAPRAVRR